MDSNYDVINIVASWVINATGGAICLLNMSLVLTESALMNGNQKKNEIRDGFVPRRRN